MSAERSGDRGESAFEWLTGRLLELTSLGEILAAGDPRRREMTVRGTVRLALKQAGLPQEDVSADELRVVIERVLPDLLRSRLVSDAPEICRRLASEISQQPFRQTQREDRLGSFLKRAVT
jgi:hypothetical protein